MTSNDVPAESKSMGDSLRPSVDSVALQSSSSLIDRYSGQWWVLHTRARNEKVVAAHLSRRGVQYFLPLVRRQRVYQGMRRTASIPLFPGYVFMCGDEDARCEALKTNRVANVIEVAGQEQLKSDLRQIEQVVNSDEPVDLYPRLRKGARCRVIAGSLRGIEGVVLRRRGPWRVYVGVRFVGQSAELEIDPEWLELID